MKKIILSKEGEKKFQRGQISLYRKDIDLLQKSFLPGEWVILLNNLEEALAIGFVNLNVSEDRPIFQFVESIEKGELNNYLKLESDEEIFSIVKSKIEKAINYRENNSELEGGCRPVYGHSDSLPGLIVDKYKNLVLIQINTAGLDRFRERILELFKAVYPEKSVYLLDNKKYRENEVLPFYESSIGEQKIYIEENGLGLTINPQNMQKIGYYYDHRKNRQKFESILRTNKRKLQKGLDLFSYIGSWGLHLLRSGVTHVTFVDRGNFEKDINLNLFNNGFEGRGEFVQKEILSYLDEMIKERKTFDVICVDPPAFAKKISDKKNALIGYQKIFDKVFEVIEKNGFLAACSCTYSVNFEDLDQVVQKAASKKKKKIRIIDIGLQGVDHPISSLSDKANYLKYLAYWIE